ncbi:protein translocase subunit SecD [Salinarimonas chemoclinalis]|uniref:protein translocase subunit SecD n=1 Tax=Salinarimonas chemoclinalis TaxID=3241599 RepID=UPI0035564034
MLRFKTSTTIAILVAVAFGMLLAMPNLLSQSQRDALAAATPSFVPSFLVPTQGIVLGLDLQGGSHVLLEVDVDELMRREAQNLRDQVRQALRETRTPLEGGIQTTTRGVSVRVPDDAARARLLPLLEELEVPLQNAAIGQSATAVVVTEGPGGLINAGFTEAGVTERVSRAVSQAIEVLRQRVDALGTTEPNIQRQGEDRILVQVPGLQDPERLKTILGETAQLEFRFLANPGDSDVEMLPSEDLGGEPVAVERQIIVGGEDLIDAQPAFDQQTNEPVVNFRFNVSGAQRFGDATTRNVGRQLAIVLDDRVISAPRVQSPITGGSGQISGRFSVQEANDLSVLLRAGALPARLTIVEERTVGPGLGADSIRAGVTAAIVGALLVVLFMVSAYGFFGVLATISLTVNVILILGLLSALGATLTLPGIAGIVLTIGMAVDSNVLIFERVREEERLGRSAVSALDTGFARALGTILDANITTLIAAAVLFFLGTGPVRGFAVTLSLGIITTVFTAYTLTRLMVATWFRVRRPKSLAV